MADGTVKILVQTNATSAAKQFTKLNTSIKSTSTSANVMAANTTKANSSVAMLSKSVKGLATVYALMKAVQLSKVMSKTSTEFDSLTNRMRAASLSAEDNRASFEYLADVTERLGLDYLTTANSFAKFQASAVRSGLTFKETRDIFDDVSTAVTSMQLSTQDAELVFLALEQMASKGVVSSEELRRQLGERLPGAMEIAAQSMGMTTAEFNKLIATGSVMSKDFLPKFSKAIKKELGGSVEQASKTARANFTRFGNSITVLSDALGDELNPALSDMAKILSGELSDNVTGLANGFGFIVDNIELVIKAIWALKQTADTVFRSVYELIKLPLTSLKALYAAISDPKQAMEDLKNSIVNGQEAVKTSGDEARDAWNSAGKAVDDVYKRFETNIQTPTRRPDTMQPASNIGGDDSLEATKTSWQQFKDMFQGDSESMGDAISDNIGGAFAEVISSGEASFQSLGQSILSIFANVAGSLASSGISSAIKSVDWGSVFGTTVASANGNVFSGGNIQAFANGGAFTNGIVSKPTFFPMANGNTGFMGEKGAEAIMPLTRKNGKLGVEASGTSGGNVSVYNQTNSQIQVVKRPDNDIDLFVKQTRSVMSSEGSKGAMATALSRQQTSGVQGA